MNKNYPIFKGELFEFIDRAGKATYTGGGKEVSKPQRPGFIELEYSEGDLSYRDSYTGYVRSRGTETVRFKGKPIWISLYGGGMIEGKEDLAHQTFEFLKKAMLQNEEGYLSLRGPHKFESGDWSYKYDQEGDIFEFWGYEEIYYKGELVFFHRIIGGIVRDKDVEL